MSGMADDWAAALDQMKAGMRDIAHTLASYVADLEAAGFSRDEALRIAIGWQAAIIAGSQSGGED